MGWVQVTMIVWLTVSVVLALMLHGQPTRISFWWTSFRVVLLLVLLKNSYFWG
jgi:hypothetical protein